MKWDRTKGRPEPIRALNRIQEHENGEPLVDMRTAAPSLVPMRPVVIPWCRECVARMAESAAQSLPGGLRLGYVEAWRPLVRQQRIFEWMWGCLKEARPGLSHAMMRRTVCRWVAPVDQKAPPGHCTGAALDVYLLDSDGQELDVTSPFDRFRSTPTYTFGLSDEAQRNRTVLVEAMLSAGFSNCRDEFWHYSYGDAGWAVRTGRKDCFYGLVELPESEWRESQVQWEAALSERVNPFLSRAP